MLRIDLKTIRATQEKIEQLIGLDFETFINSAFLRQGQSNEFSKKSPKERKQILSSILGFEKYDHMHQKALEFARKYADDKKLLLRFQEQQQAELAKEIDLVSTLSKEKEQLTLTNQTLQTLQQKLTQTEHEKRALEAEKKEFENLTLQLVALENTKKTKNNDLITILQAWKRVHSSSLKIPAIKPLEDEKWSLIKQEKTYLEIQQKQLILQEKILQTKELYQKHRDILQKTAAENLYNLRVSLEKQDLTLKHLQATIQQKEVLKAEISQKIIALEQELISLQEKGKVKDEFDKKFAGTKAQFEKRRTFYQALIQKGNWTKNELSELEQKKKVVHDHSNPACPLCEQVLTIKRKVFLSNQIAQQEAFLTYRLSRIGALIKKLKELLVVQHQEVEQMQKESDIFANIASKQEDAAKQIERTEKEYLSIDLEVKNLAKQQSEATIALQSNKELLKKQEQEAIVIIDQDSELIKLGQQYQQFELEKKSLTFDKDTYQNIQKQLQQIELLLQQLEIIKPELDQQQTRKLSIQRICHEIKTLKHHQKVLHDQIAQKTCNPEKETLLVEIINALNKEIAQLLHQKERTVLGIGSFENELQRIKKIKDEQQQNIEKLRILDNEIDDYQAIAQALSKNGIQALLIEEAIPEIEAEANTILAKLTDNQAQIFIESLRDLKSGGVKETLDIQISDTVGIRPYEMFSGGEAFRVDFALRIAISKLLARRAGTALQTLIIDEGFGSQDEEGLARIMESIYAIQKDFSKIIIVSHLVEFKDNFPVHFVIEKSSSGSNVTVEERG